MTKGKEKEYVSGRAPIREVSFVSVRSIAAGDPARTLELQSASIEPLTAGYLKMPFQGIHSDSPHRRSSCSD